MTKTKDIVCCILFIVLWLLPAAYTGVTYKDFPFLPRGLTYFHRISHLFTRFNPVWPVYFIQASTSESGPWRILDQSEFFSMKPFGYRSRLHELMVPSKDMVGFPSGKNTHLARQKELATWIAQRYKRLHPTRKPLKKIRFAAGFYKVRAKPGIDGHWQDKDINDFDNNEVLILSEHEISDAR